MYGRRIRLLRRSRSYPPNNRELSYSSVERRFPPIRRSGPTPPTSTTTGMAADRPDDVFVTRTKPSWVPSPAFDGTVIETAMGVMPRPGIDVEAGAAETHAQSV